MEGSKVFLQIIKKRQNFFLLFSFSSFLFDRYFDRLRSMSTLFIFTPTTIVMNNGLFGNNLTIDPTAPPVLVAMESLLNPVIMDTLTESEDEETMSFSDEYLTSADFSSDEDEEIFLNSANQVQ